MTEGPPPAQPPGPPYQYLPSPYGRQEAQYATAAMVLGILSLVLMPLACCCGIGELLIIPLGILAVIFGFTARSRIAASQGALGGDGKALAGIITGATGAGIGIALGFAILVFGITASTFTNAIPTPSG